MKQKTKHRIEASVPDFDEVRALGYEIHKFEPWHYRISHPDYETKVDVWPTTQKLWKCDSRYTDTYLLGELPKKIEDIFADEQV